MPGLTRPQVSRVLREVLAKRHWTRADLWQWLVETQRHNACAHHAHAKRRRRLRDPPLLSANTITTEHLSL
jgi:hypothetical protein